MKSRLLLTLSQVPHKKQAFEAHEEFSVQTRTFLATSFFLLGKRRFLSTASELAACLEGWSRIVFNVNVFMNTRRGLLSTKSVLRTRQGANCFLFCF